jgi:hypothetical protein
MFIIPFTKASNSPEILYPDVLSRKESLFFTTSNGTRVFFSTAMSLFIARGFIPATVLNANRLVYRGTAQPNLITMELIFSDFLTMAGRQLPGITV